MISTVRSGVLLVFLAALGGCSLCGNRILLRQASPMRAWTAVVYERDCGATTPVYTVVELLPRGKDGPDENDPGGVVISFRNPQDVSVQWADDSHLRVVCSSCRGVNLATERTKVNSVAIEYVLVGQ